MKRLLLGLCILFLLTASFSPIDNHYVYVSTTNIFQGVFTEPFEILYVLCENGDKFEFTTHDENAVRVTPQFLKEFLESKGQSLEAVVMMMHNHFATPKMSEKNIRFLYILRRLGYNGTFGVYDTSSGVVICVRKICASE